MNKTLIIDNFDSFTYNLVQYVGELGGNPQVFRNNEITLDQVKKLNPSHIILSPGPGNPENVEYFGICKDILHNLQSTPLLGVCLGMQGIVLEFGGRIISAPEIMHGKSCAIFHTQQGIFAGIQSPLQGMRYHSLIADPHTIPEFLEITARTEQGTVMGIQHKELPFFGVQFHPESIGTPEGKKILNNFLSL